MTLSLACSLGNGDSTPVIVKRLPPFTRTPLPPLENSAIASTSIAAANPAESGEVTPNGPIGAAESSSVTGDVAGSSDNTVAPPGPGQVETSAEALSSGSPQPIEGAGPNNASDLSQPGQQTPTSFEPTLLSTPVSGAETTEPSPTLGSPELPTSTPTLAVGIASPTSDQPATTSSPTVTPTPMPGATPTPNTSSTGGWTFSAVSVINDIDGMLLFGEVVNNTGSAQELFYISGNFFDNLGQQVAGEEDSDSYVPLDVVPPGSRVPFELTVYDVQDVANYELWANSEASNAPPRQDFAISEVEQRDDQGDYCLTGVVRNPGSELTDYLVVVGTFFDDQNKVISFGDDYYTNIEDIVGDKTLDFEVCIETPSQAVSRYETFAWGQ